MCHSAIDYFAELPGASCATPTLMTDVQGAKSTGYFVGTFLSLSFLCGIEEPIIRTPNTPERCWAPQPHSAVDLHLSQRSVKRVLEQKAPLIGPNNMGASLFKGSYGWVSVKAMLGSPVMTQCCKKSKLG